MINIKFLKSHLTGNIYPQQVDSHSFTTEDFAEKLRQRYGSVAPCIVNDMISLIGERLAGGDTVTLNRLGTFSLRLGVSKQSDDVRTQDVKVKGIRFTAAKTLRSKVSRQNIHRVKEAEHCNSTTTIIRWNVFLTHMFKDSENLGKPINELPVTVNLYRLYTGATDYTARKDLAKLCADGMLTSISTAHAKVYLIPTHISSNESPTSSTL